MLTITSSGKTFEIPDTMIEEACENLKYQRYIPRPPVDGRLGGVMPNPQTPDDYLAELFAKSVYIAAEDRELKAELAKARTKIRAKSKYSILQNDGNNR